MVAYREPIFDAPSRFGHKLRITPGDPGGDNSRLILLTAIAIAHL
jgi:hypothetical protein